MVRESLRVGVVVTGAMMMSACDATLHGTFSSVASGAPSIHVGGAAEGRVHLPPDYKIVLGVESAHLGQIDPATSADQWRAGGVVGYSPLLRPDAGRLSHELTVRMGFFRGSSGPLVYAGLYGGLALAAPFRISPNRDSWELDDTFYTTWMIVPQIGFNTLLPELRVKDTAIEIAFGLGVRMNLSSTLLP